VDHRTQEMDKQASKGQMDGQLLNRLIGLQSLIGSSFSWTMLSLIVLVGASQ